jgi:BRCT domain type II-containing protein
MSILKGKAKEMDPEEMIIEPPKASGSKAAVPKMNKKKKKPARRSRSASKSSRSESKGSERLGRSSSSSSSRSPSPSPARQTYIRFEDMNKDLKNALRVSIIFVYLPNCILTDLCFTISLKSSG